MRRGLIAINQPPKSRFAWHKNVLSHSVSRLEQAAGLSTHAPVVVVEAEGLEVLADGDSLILRKAIEVF